MRQIQRGSRLLLWMAIIGTPLLWGCGEDATIKAKEEQSIQMVKAYQVDRDSFSVISNIEKEAADSAREGDKWELGPWEAGLPSQKDLVMEKLSQFFNVFRPTGDYWVRFTYKDKAGTHTGEWNVNIYSKKVVPKNDVAQRFSAPAQPAGN
ncbi:MAG: hypothetical protein AB7G75_24495 [Candidatus Binatia bacterium]